MNANGAQSYPEDSAPKAAMVKLKFSFNCSEPNLFQLIYLSKSYHGITVPTLHLFIL